MAEITNRFNPIFRAGGYWRAELSRRESDGDPHHFATEWTGTITDPPSTAWTWWTFSPIRISAMNEDGLFVVDNVEFEFAFNTAISDALNPDESVSAAIRLWYSPDASSWSPIFWGEIDLETADREVIRIVAGAARKVFRFTARDSLSRLGETAFTDRSRVTPTLIGWSNNIYIGGENMTNVLDWFQGGTVQTTLMSVHSGSTRIVSLKFYMEEIAKIVYDEHYFRTVTAPKAVYGYGVTPISGPFRYVSQIGGGYPVPTPAPTLVEKTFDDLYIQYDLFSTDGHLYASEPREDWTNEYDTWGDALAAFMLYCGFAVTTKHQVESGRWVRSLNYISVDGENDFEIESEGVLTHRTGARFKRSNRRVTVTTRTMKDSFLPVPDVVVGAGPEKKFATPFRTLGAYSPNQTITNMNGEHKARILWQCPLIKDGTDYRFVNAVKLVLNSTYWPSANAYPMWATNFLRWNGAASAIAQFEDRMNFKRGRRMIEEEFSRITANDGTTSSPLHYKPFAKLINDTEFPGDFRLLECEMDGETGKVRIVKEEM